MITKLSIKNFKKLAHAEFELGRSVVFVGPNNSGKTSALQAITLWELGLRQWAGNIKNINKQNIKTINRYDVFAAPVPSVRQLWKDLYENVFLARRLVSHRLFYRLPIRG